MGPSASVACIDATEGAMMVTAISGLELGRAAACRAHEVNASGEPAGQCPPEPPWSPRLRTCGIEVQRQKSMRHDKGLIELNICAVAQP